MTLRAFEFAAGRPWLMQADALRNVLQIAQGLGDPEALAAKLGQPLANTRTADRRPNGVAIVPVTGPIFRYANLFTEISGATSAEILARDIQVALDDPTVKGIVLDINSPGGEVTGINELAAMIYNARGRKPISAYVGGLGASAAYWLASSASSVVVDATAMLGSIGVVMTHVDTTARDAKSDTKRIEIVSSNSPDKRINPAIDEGRAKIQVIVDQLATVFVEAVARNRGVTASKVNSDFGRGGVLVGAAAVKAGMADRLGSLEDVIGKLGSGAPVSTTSRTASAATASKIDTDAIYAARIAEGWDKAIAKASGQVSSVMADPASLSGIYSRRVRRL